MRFALKEQNATNDEFVTGFNMNVKTGVKSVIRL